jgi:hypothetical protein
LDSSDKIGGAVIAMVNAFRWTIFVIGLVVVIGSIMITSAEEPLLTIESHYDGEMVDFDTITVSGCARGTGGAVVDLVTVNDVPATGTSLWSAEVSLQLGPNPITVVATDDINNSGTKTITVILVDGKPTSPPKPSSYVPSSAPAQSPTPTPTPKLTGSISITTIPSGAKVYLDDSPTKKNTNITLENVTVGYHEIKVTKEGFHSEKRIIRLWAGKTKELNIPLTQLTGSIAVFSTPSGASVHLDNVYKRDTNCMLSEVVVGQHTIKLTKSDYDDVISNVSVCAGRTFHLHKNLTESTRHGSIIISSDPPGAKVYLDSNYTGETPKNISTVALGNHTIKLTLSDYFDVIRNVSVSVGETCPLRVNLTGYGSLCISSNPSKAKVYLDDVYKGETALNISKVVVGTHTIKLTKWSYEDVEKMIHVSAGELIEEDVTLSIQAWGKTLIEGGVILAIFIGILRYVVIPVISPKLKKKSLFNLDQSYKQCLKDGDVDAELKKVFKEKEQPLTSEAKVSKIPEQWRIVDGKKQYRVEDSGKQLDIYKK